MAPPLRASRSARASIAVEFFGSAASTRSKRCFASATFLSARSSSARVTAAGKKAGLICKARSKLLRAPAVSRLAKRARPRRPSVAGLSGCLRSSASIALSALSNSLRRRNVAINARSAVVPLSDAAIFSSSAEAPSTWPDAMCTIAKEVAFAASVGSSLAAFEKYSSARAALPFCRYTSPASASMLALRSIFPSTGSSADSALAGCPRRE